MHRTGTRQTISYLPLLVVVAALAIACAQLATDARLFAPSWVIWQADRFEADFDGDGASERVSLAGGLLEIDGDDKRVRTPRAWAVSDVFWNEIDEEPGPEVALVVWKRGSYGQARPFWVMSNDADMSQHIFIYKYRDGALRPIWMSSALEVEARVVTLDDAGRFHLVDSEGNETVWQWEYWGLKLFNDAANAEASISEEANGAPGNGPEGEQSPTSSAGSSATDGDATSTHADSTVTLVAVGDNIVYESLYAQMKTKDGSSFDFSPAYEHIAPLVSQADLAAVVQETPFVTDPSAYSGYPDFGTPTAVGDALASCGFDIICSATNHAYDKGPGGIGDTIDFWRESHTNATLLGIHDDPRAQGGFAIREANGIRFALFDYAYGLNGNGLPAGREYLVDTLADADRLYRNLDEAEGAADCSICFLHIGDEYAAGPTDEQANLVKQLVDHGADVVICSHPHVVQPCERIETPSGNEGVVYWSLGNFASHQQQLRTILGGMASLSFKRDATGVVHVNSFELIPLVCHYTDTETTVYPLDDYTAELASRHFLNDRGSTVSLESLNNAWSEATGPVKAPGRR